MKRALVLAAALVASSAVAQSAQPGKLVTSGAQTFSGVKTFVKIVTTTTGNAVEIPSGSRLGLNGSATTAGVISYSPGTITYTAGGGSVHSFDQTLQLTTGRFVMPATDASGSPGAATINSASGKIAVAAGASSVVVTDSLVSTASIVFAVLQANDSTCTAVKSVIPAAGSFTIALNANCTAAAKLGFVTFN